MYTKLHSKRYFGMFSDPLTLYLYMFSVIYYFPRLIKICLRIYKKQFNKHNGDLKFKFFKSFEDIIQNSYILSFFAIFPKTSK